MSEASNAPEVGGSKPIERDPLRKVIARGLFPVTVGQSVTDLPSDLLECGHRLSEASDIYGPRSPARRRCYKCRLGAPTNFDPSDFDDTSAPQ